MGFELMFISMTPHTRQDLNILTTQWLDAKNPQDEQKKYEMLLDDQSMQNLINALKQ
jgi:hypothetical protein